MDDPIAGAKAAGVTVIRMWAFNNGASYAIQPTLGSYNETALRQLDYAVSKAKANGIRVILTLVNYWTDFNGMQWYVDQALGTGQPISKFYIDSTVKQAYKNYVTMLLNRVNFYTGIAYKNDSTIFSWELANEPRCESDVSGAAVYNWLNEMSAYIKSIDGNHMVSTGEEGFRTDGKTDWTDNGYEGVNFSKNVTIPNIDFATVHMYPDDWGQSESWVTNFLNDRASIAHSAGKPIVFEEFGVETTKGNRDTRFANWINTATSNSYDGIMPWQMEVTGNNSYSFSFGSSTGTIIKNMCAAQAAKNTGGGTTLFDFEGTLSGWTGIGMSGGPYYTTDWAYSGIQSAKIDVNLANSSVYYLNDVASSNFTGKTALMAAVRTASWGTINQVWVKLYIKTGSGWTWYDSGAAAINSGTSGTVLTLNLSGIANLSDVREIGIEYSTSASGNSGQTSLYVDNVTVK